MYLYIGWLSISFLAISTIYLGSIFSSLLNIKNEESSTELTGWQALLMPFTSSIALMTLFFFFDYVKHIISSLLMLTSVYSFFIVISILFEKLCVNVRLRNVCSILFTCAMTIEWMHSGNFVVHNILCSAICILGISVLKFPNLKVAQYFMGGLLIYDIYWVFFSSYLFKENVMVSVATKVSTNPLQSAGQALGIPLLIALKSSMELPIKLIVEVSSEKKLMLGLGDVMIPGMFVCFARKIDTSLSRSAKEDDEENPREFIEKSLDNENRNSSSSLTYFHGSLLGYTIGLFIAFYVSFSFQAAQPALIYLVPGVLLPFYFNAWRRGQFGSNF